MRFLFKRQECFRPIHRFLCSVVPISISWILLFFLGGCSPTIKPVIDLSKMEVPGPSFKGPEFSGALIFVDNFRDARLSQVLVQGGSKTSTTESDLTKLATKSLSDALVSLGFVLTESSPVIISGSLEEWKAEVESGLPSKVITKARIGLEAFDPANKLIYKGSYEGYSSIEHPSLGEEDIVDSLANAMGEAIEQVTKDQRLLQVVTSF